MVKTAAPRQSKLKRSHLLVILKEFQQKGMDSETRENLPENVPQLGCLRTHHSLSPKERVKQEPYITASEMQVVEETIFGRKRPDSHNPLE